MSHHHPQPDKVELSSKEFTDLADRIKSSNLPTGDSDLIIKSLNFMFWLQGSLEHAKISVKKLQKLFGIIPRSKKKNKKNIATDDENEPESGGTEKTPDDSDNPTKKTSNDIVVTTTKTGGRIPHTAYTNAEVVWLNHHTLSAGDLCPIEYCTGKLYQPKPCVILKIEGQGFAKATRYNIQHLRCSLCGERQLVNHKLSCNKYSESLVSQLIMHKYYLALPFYRLENYQKLIGVPLPDSTQWQLISDGYSKLKPIFSALEDVAANAKLFCYDDTRLRILSVMKDNVANPNKKRTGQFTTVILAQTSQGPVSLFYSSTKHAGENMQALINRRSEEQGSFIAMSDALGSNRINHNNVIEANCMAHAIVKFIDLESVSPYDLSRPIDDLRSVFNNDKKTTQMSDEDRLHYHQKHSKPILDKLYIWMNDQLSQNKTEPNSHVGKALNYCLKHWDKLTRFLSVSGCPLSNNNSERILKVIIRLRKSSMFHKTEHGAKVCAQLLSIIQSAIDNNINPIDYLTTLLQHSNHLLHDPDKWLPWNYHDTLSSQKSLAA